MKKKVIAELLLIPNRLNHMKSIARCRVISERCCSKDILRHTDAGYQLLADFVRGIALTRIFVSEFDLL